MKFLVSFAPWFVFVGVTEALDWRAGLVAGLIAQIVVIATSKTRRIGVLNAGMIAFFVVFAVVAFVDPGASIEAQLGNLMVAWMAVVATTSIVLGHPFSIDISADEAGPEIAATPLFYDINRRISTVWAACFAIMAVASFVSSATDDSTIGTVVTVGLLIYAIKFTMSYPDKAVAAAFPTATEPAAVAPR
ncbi:MAG: hypothetical protein ABWZ99_10235 [Ilumatobacteraceae bacterium]